MATARTLRRTIVPIREREHHGHDEQRRGAGDHLAAPKRAAGRPVSSGGLGQRLKDLGIRPGQARSTALFQLASELPAALFARMLGIHIDVAVTRQRISAGDWMADAADVSRRQA